MVMQVRRTLTPSNPPTGLAEGQLAVGMADTPPTLWAGVPTSVDPSGRVQLVPASGSVDQTALATALADYLPLTGGTLAGPGGAGGTLSVQDSLTVRSTGVPNLFLTSGANTARMSVIAGSNVALFSTNGQQGLGIDTATPPVCFVNQIAVDNGSGVGRMSTGPPGNEYVFEIDSTTGNAQIWNVAGFMWSVDWLGNFAVATQGWQPGGGPWSDTSDARIKNVLGDYLHGLDEIERLEPRRYTFRGNDGDAHKAVLGKEFVGLIAQDVEDVMPEMVTKAKGVIDGREVDDLRDLNTGPLLFALVNAVKELSARVKELENAAS